MSNKPTFQEIIMRLEKFWADKGCLIWHPYNYPVGAGTMNPATFLKVLGPEPWDVAYTEPSIRPDDGRYGENPNRMQLHTQYQVILKPCPENVQELYLQSLDAIGVDRNAHDVRFVEDNWQSPALGAWGLGWEVWLDGLEITQFTYFQQAGGLTLSPNSVELTYGLERIAMFLQDVKEVWQLDWNGKLSYGDVYLQSEIDNCKFQFETAAAKDLTELYEKYEKLASETLEQGLIEPAYNFLLLCSHTFNVLDALGGIGVTERAAFFGRMRDLARRTAKLYVKSREEMEFPLLEKAEEEQDEMPEITAAVNTFKKKEDFVLEIGTEELPPRDVVSGIEQLKKLVEDKFADTRLDYGEVKVTGSPRRLVVMISDLQIRQEDRTVRKRGPKADFAFDKDGNPTKAGAGFARGQGLTPDQLEVEDGFVYASKTEKGLPSTEVLPEVLKDIISSLKFDMTMKWNESRFAFSRPLRWIVALHGARVIPFESAGVVSGRSSRSVREPEVREIFLEDASLYAETMEMNRVVFDIDKRRDLIKKQIKEIAAELGGEVPDDPGLLEEVTNLVEFPNPIKGDFEEEYLRLPKQVLIGVMKKHQRYFPVVKDGKMLPNFIVVANSGHIDKPLVKKGNEGVLRARYADAAYFVDQDVKTSLADFTSKLGKLTFQADLGSYLDKVKRIESLVKITSEALGLSDEDKAVAEKVAALCKSDLATSMVVEMTSLQGFMGMEYLKKQGGDEVVAEGIYQHYLPRTAGDAVPELAAALSVGIADRIDTLTGLFAVGLSPTGSKDPYALRRCALGLIQILHDRKISISLEKLVKEAAKLLPVEVGEKEIEDVLEFIRKRLEGVLLDEGYRHDVVQSVLAARGNDPESAKATIIELNAEVEKEDWKDVLPAYSRCVRITRKLEETYPLNADLYEEEATKTLHKAWEKAASKLTAESSAAELMAELRELIEPINGFFDNVLVMTDKEDLKKARLALLQKISTLTDGIGDLSHMEGF